MTEIRVGPAGWSYADWKGKVYPDPVEPGFDALSYLSRFFTTIEVNSTFYRPSPPRMSEGWARRTPDGFLFTVKVWEKFTPKQQEIVQGTFDEMEPTDYYAAVVKQLPLDYDNWEKANGAATVMDIDTTAAQKLMAPLNERLANEVFGAGTWDLIQNS